MARIRIIISGANGFLGSCISNFLKSKDYSISYLRRNDINEIVNSDFFKNNKFNFFNSIPILNQEYDFFIHAAAIPHYECENSKEDAITINTKLTDFLACYCQLKNICFVFLSTVQVYGSNLNGEYTENSKLNPETIYSKSKRAAELKIIERIDKFSLNSKILRLGNIVGKPLSINSSGWDLFANKAIYDAYKNKKINILNNPYLRRSFLSIDILLNFIEIIILNINNKDFYHKTIINLTSNKSLTLKEFSLLVIHYNYLLRNNIVELAINEKLLEDVPSFIICNKVLANLMPSMDDFSLEDKIKEMIISFN